MAVEWGVAIGGQVAPAHSYTYYAASQRTGTARSDASTVAYGYDALGQLTSARATNAAGQPLTSEHRGYAYDAAWNLAWRTNGLTAQWFKVDPKNQLTNSSVTGQQTYDANGNLLNRAWTWWAFSHDDENRVVVLSNRAAELMTTLPYDGLSRLRVRQEWAWEDEGEPQRAVGQTQRLAGGGGEWVLAGETRYVYDGRRVVQERDGGNGPAVRYTRGREPAPGAKGVRPWSFGECPGSRPAVPPGKGAAATEHPTLDAHSRRGCHGPLWRAGFAGGYLVPGCVVVSGLTIPRSSFGVAAGASRLRPHNGGGGVLPAPALSRTEFS